MMQKKMSWIGLELHRNGIDCNRDATGTRVKISYLHLGKQIMQHHEVVASNGLSAQGDHRLLFGLADYQRKVTVDIN